MGPGPTERVESSSDASSSSSSERRAKKRVKKEKKRHKKEKKRRMKEEETRVSAFEPLAERPAAEEKEEACPAVVTRHAFFAALKASEARKPAVGTVHATGKKDEEAKTEKEGDWDCHKCFYRNFKESLTCAKCRALRRFEGRNQAYGYCM